ncbi:hypothetical protein CPB84DRAFT_1777781 [Gymnopilus junonius]|uniref:Uncharacterized protein n=1 Tax=Gymnopilus junonius TaxID=109634 RepID=A0A9P5NLM0_GYMJU|nr:hypothetical protein CPB84DRAFT_1777781 [Gymnopilus junonius]
MAAAQVPTYAHAIPSLSETIPTLPALGDLDINRAIAANAPIDRANLTNAKVVAKAMKATFESAVNPGVTEEMVETAELRLRAVEGAHTAAKYSPPGLMTGIAAILQRLDQIDQRLDTIDGRLDGIDQHLDGIDNRLHTVEDDVKLTKAITLNHRIIARNEESQPVCQPLYKTVEGSGHDRARELTSRADRRALNAPAVPPAIGTLPPNFENNITAYTTKDISQIISFYNQDFGITVDDSEPTRRTKLIKFLTRF